MAISRRSVSASLSSPRLAVGLMLYLGLYAFAGTLVPQGGPSTPSVATWAASHRALEVVVSAIGFHQAYYGALFLLPMALLAASTVACAWKRTRLAWTRFGVLSAIRAGRPPSSPIRPSFEIDAPGLSAAESLDLAEHELGALGLRVRRSGDRLWRTSQPAFALASPLFHWSLVALMLVLPVGLLSRSDGLVGVPVGEAVQDAPASYGVLTAGPLHRWQQPPLSITVDRFEPSFVFGGLDRGPTPTVAIRSADGKVLASQRVYPNSPLRYGSVIVHPNDHGLAATFALLNPDGAELTRSTSLVDFDESAAAGTAPGEMTLSDSSGQPAVRVAVTIPLPRKDAQVVRLLPRSPVARLRVTATDGSLIGSETLRPDEAFRFADGTSLRLLGVNYYARLNVVDDWTVPLLYAALLLALGGVSAALLGGQHLLLLTATDCADGTKVAGVVRMWRGGAQSAEQIEAALRAGFGREREKGSEA